MDFPFKMYLVRGNHDNLPTSEYLSVFDEVYGAFRYKSYWFTHIPIHTQELFRGNNVHGHCHRGGPFEVEGDPRYFNAILEYNEYKPINMQKLGTTIKERETREREKYPRKHYPFERSV
jgi:calcineurin-like phosphoesterase family protein